MSDIDGSPVTLKEKKVKKRKFVIEDVITKDIEKPEPCIVRFANGVYKGDPRLPAKLYRNGSELFVRRRKERILKIEGSHLEYSGKNFGPEVANSFQEKLFVGILDKQTNKMKLVEASSFLVHPQINTFNLDTNSKPDDSKNINTQLLKDFGGRKGRSMARRYQEKEERVGGMSSALRDAFEGVDSAPLTEQENSTDVFAHILPKCYREAEIVNEVYKLEDIITDDELLPLNDQAMLWLTEEDTDKYLSEQSALFPYFLASAKLQIEESDRAKTLCASLYAEELIKLLKFSSNGKLNFKCPKNIQWKITSTFTENRMRKPFKSEVDKICCYVIVLSLILCGYQVPFQQLGQALGLKKEKLEILIRIVGAKLHKDIGSVGLQIPLEKMPKKTPMKPKRN